MVFIFDTKQELGDLYEVLFEGRPFVCFHETQGALQWLHGNAKPAAIIVDLSFEGWGLLGHIKTNSAWKDIPVVACTFNSHIGVKFLDKFTDFKAFLEIMGGLAAPEIDATQPK